MAIPTFQPQQLQIPDYAQIGQNADELASINAARQTELMNQQRQAERAQAVNQYASLAVKGDPQAMQTLMAIDPDRGRKTFDFLYAKSEREAAYATAQLNTPASQQKENWARLLEMAKNDPLIDNKELDTLPREWTPDTAKRLQVISQSHRKLEDVLKAPQQAADLEQTKASTAKIYADIARTREETSNIKNNVGVGNEKAPSGYRFTAKGDLEAIPGGPAIKQSAESAGKVALIKQGLSDAKKLEEALVEKDGSFNRAKITGLRTYGRPGARDEYSKLFNAINARLRLESGAAVPKSEVESAFEVFAPSPLDSDATIRSKLDRMKEFFVSAESEIGQGRGADPLNFNGDFNNKPEEDPLGLFK